LKTNSNFESLQIDEDEQIFEIFFYLMRDFIALFKTVKRIVIVQKYRTQHKR